MESFDVVIVGGSFAGLSAAVQLARGRRRITIVDSGQPRNRFAEASHGFFGQDGANPLEMIARARMQVLAYPTVTLIEGEVTAAEGAIDAFRLDLANGDRLQAARIVLAHGVTDVLPEIPGLAERWGHSVIHCPYCHGYEYAGQRLGVLASTPPSAHHAILIREWGPTTLFLNGQDLDDVDRTLLESRDIAIEPAPVTSLAGTGKDLTHLTLADGREIPLDALLVAPRTHGSALARMLGCAMEEGPNGPYIRIDQTRATTIPGVFAAGDITTPAGNATMAAADGAMAGAAAHRSLIFAGIC